MPNDLVSRLQVLLANPSAGNWEEICSAISTLGETEVTPLLEQLAGQLEKWPPHLRVMPSTWEKSSVLANLAAIRTMVVNNDGVSRGNPIQLLRYNEPTSAFAIADEPDWHHEGGPVYVCKKGEPAWPLVDAQETEGCAVDLSFSPMGDQIAVLLLDPVEGVEVRVFECETYTELYSKRFAFDDASDVEQVFLYAAIAHSGKQIACALPPGRVILWSADETPETRREFDTGECVSVITWVDDCRLLLGFCDGSVSLWSIEEGERIAGTQAAHECPVVALAVDEVRRSVVSVSSDSAVVWGVDPDWHERDRLRFDKVKELKRNACSVVARASGEFNIALAGEFAINVLQLPRGRTAELAATAESLAWDSCGDSLLLDHSAKDPATGLEDNRVLWQWRKPLGQSK